MKLGKGINGGWVGLTIVSYPGPNIIRNDASYTYYYVLIDDFLNYANAIYKKNDSICEWQLRLYIYPLYNSEVVDISHTMINHNDLDWNDKPIVVTAKKGFRIVRGYD